MNGPLAWLLVGVLGGAGAVARFAVDRAVSARITATMPLGTFTVNAAGAFLLGLMTGGGVGGDTRLVLGGGLVGAFTTFSTWMFETHRLAEDPGPRHALPNIALGVAVGLVAAAAGWALGAVFT